ncbi:MULTISPECIES: hypothetical protein [Lonsdalea]|uniref:Uncharacterized protein n=2 Tax=Lonsdalea TaxID=1082702 RepID=A0ACD1J9F5_9GAMM|nr:MULTISPECIES: hypothetical protein [Lonsdalea]RAT10779.1 hypothetical protein AU485_15825 [Lonsdalea quercina]RAT19081.1 hypothetical protein AU487_12535 [Lonsdalea populi]RAT20382.1 hypothetical protein AU489_16295 [Lonsdalea populi]RAT23495.1 hypothetical protein AU488_09665 [Lonsdalea populi]RAT32549.1 hypothetical protein AU492_12570 [Lonsdalea populi]
MTSLTMNKSARTSKLNSEHAIKTLLQARIDSLSKEYIDNLSKVDDETLLSLLTLPDDEFWTELKILAFYTALINKSTKEKEEQIKHAENRLAFLKSLEKYGGVHKSTAVKKILSVSIPTIHKYGNQNKIIVLNWSTDKLYPAFQFSIEKDFTENGMLKGVPELLALLSPSLSGVRRCNFFTRKLEMPDDSKKMSVVDILRRGATPTEMVYLRILAENFGTMNAV